MAYYLAPLREYNSSHYPTQPLLKTALKVNNQKAEEITAPPGVQTFKQAAVDLFM